MLKRWTSLWMMIGLALMVAVGFTACGDDKISDDMTPTQTVEVFLDAFKAQDEDRMDQVYAGKGNDFMSAYKAREGEETSALTGTIQTDLMNKWYEFDYEITGEEISQDGKTATVDLAITTYDMKAVFSSFYQEYMSQALEQFSGNSNNVTQDQYDEMAARILKEQVDKATEKDYTGQARLTLTKADGRWVVDKIGEDNEDFLNAITGGLMEVLQDVVDAREDTGDSKSPEDTGDSEKADSDKD